MNTTTLNKIRERSPCADGWEKLLRTLCKTKADDEPLSLITILDSNGLDDALWCLRAVDGHEKEMRLFAVWCARQVQHLMKDTRSLNALDVAERFAHGKATLVELDDASDAARYAACAAVDAARSAAWIDAARDDASDATRSAAWIAAAWAAARAAARDAMGVAWVAARDDASDATRSAAWIAAAWAAARAAARDAMGVAWVAARDAMGVAWVAARGAGRDAACAAARAAQEVKFREMFGEQKPDREAGEQP